MKDISMHEVYEMTPAWPSKLVTAEDASPDVGVPAEQLLSWASEGICPHFRINGGKPLFRVADVRKWMIAAQVIEECIGVTKREAFSLRVINHKPSLDDLPFELRSVGKILDVSSSILPSGVYFLYLNGSLQYIGQSVEPATRLYQHKNNGRVFDRAYVVPVPEFMLDQVEGALIRHFRPPLNGNSAPRSDIPDEQTLSQFGIEIKEVA